MNKLNKEIEKIEAEIKKTKDIGFSMALSGFNPYSFTGSKLDRLYEELNKLKEKQK